jgi:hypothetical protein
MSEPGKNTGDEEQVAEARKVTKIKVDQAVLDMRSILGMASGRRVLRSLLAWCRVSNSVVAVDPYQTYRYAGHQEAGHYLLAQIIKADPKACAQILEESYADELKGDRNV